MFQNFAFSAAGRQVDAPGTFFRYESATGGGAQAINVRADGNDLGSLLPGDSVELVAPASAWVITPLDGAAGVVRVGRGRVTTSRTTLAGNLTATIATGRNPATPGTVTPRNITTSSQVIMGANTGRNYLAIQNNSASGFLYLAFDRAATTADFRIGPLQTWEWCAYAPTGSLNIIGDVANSFVVTVEG